MEQIKNTMIEKIKHNASCLLGISDDWSISDVKEHLKWLINNPDEIANGYEKEYITSKHMDETMRWVRVYKTKQIK